MVKNMSERFKPIPTGSAGKEDYRRKYNKEQDKAYRESKLWDNLKKDKPK